MYNDDLQKLVLCKESLSVLTDPRELLREISALKEKYPDLKVITYESFNQDFDKACMVAENIISKLAKKIAEASSGTLARIPKDSKILSLVKTVGRSSIAALPGALTVATVSNYAKIKERIDLASNVKNGKMQGKAIDFNGANLPLETDKVTISDLLSLLDDHVKILKTVVPIYRLSLIEANRIPDIDYRKLIDPIENISQEKETNVFITDPLYKGRVVVLARKDKDSDWNTKVMTIPNPKHPKKIIVPKATELKSLLAKLKTLSDTLQETDDSVINNLDKVTNLLKTKFKFEEKDSKHKQKTRFINDLVLNYYAINTSSIELSNFVSKQIDSTASIILKEKM